MLKDASDLMNKAYDDHITVLLASCDGIAVGAAAGEIRPTAGSSRVLKPDQRIQVRVRNFAFSRISRTCIL